MPDLLLEFFSEEIPARMQAKAADDLRKLVTDALVEAGLVYEGAKAFVTPRRLALTVAGVPASSPDVKEERKGPKVGAPEQAIAGFMKAAGLTDISQAKVQQDKKGDFYVAITEKKGRPAIDVIAEIVPKAARALPWPKSMRWGAASANEGAPVWVRPLHSVVAMFGPETEEPEIVKFDVGSVKSGDETRGHRFMAPAAIKVKRFDDYVAALEKAKVVLDPARRREMILADARNLAFAQGFELVEDEGLLNEAAGLVEWPVVLMGSFDKAFLTIPDEVIRATIRNNQKCFVLRDPQTAKLVNKFILVANEEASDGGKQIVAGNERVIRARLSDAKFFYETDLKTKLEARLPKFEHIVFHEKLGSQARRIGRLEWLAVELAPLVGANVNEVRRAARLAKADLLTDVVGEFPETQGLMGRYYALAQKEPENVAWALEEHWKPRGSLDGVPNRPVSIAVGLADKIDMLSGFWAIDEKPSGSKDPFALRRAALGVVKTIIENRLRIPIADVLHAADIEVFLDIKTARLDRQRVALSEVSGQKALSEAEADRIWNRLVDRAFSLKEVKREDKGANHRVFNLLDYLVDRIEEQFRAAHVRKDLIQAALSISLEDDLLLIVRRVEALGKFLDTDDGKNLLAGTKRAENILRIEEKKDKKAYTGAPDSGLLKEPEEKALASAIATARKDASDAVGKEDFAAAMSAMAKLRPAVDAFFEKVTVNADDARLRENRLKLLNEIRQATRAVADFSRIEG